jgi:hypothetical protein
MDTLCAETSQVIPPTQEKIIYYKNFARNNCLKVGGIKKTDFCPNQKYLYTINKKVLGYDICVKIYQCVGMSWECLRSSGGYIE